MKNKTSHTLIRFRCWTRKGYAIFSSLGCHVTIGTLGREVVDASLKKQKAGIPVSPHQINKNVINNDEPEDDLPDGTAVGLRLNCFPLPAGETHHAEYNHYIKTKFNNISRKDI